MYQVTKKKMALPRDLPRKSHDLNKNIFLFLSKYVIMANQHLNQKYFHLCNYDNSSLSLSELSFAQKYFRIYDFLINSVNTD